MSKSPYARQGGPSADDRGHWLGNALSLPVRYFRVPSESCSKSNPPTTRSQSPSESASIAWQSSNPVDYTTALGWELLGNSLQAQRVIRRKPLAAKYIANLREGAVLVRNLQAACY